MEQPPGGPEGKPEGAGGPGWINPTVQTKIAWRDGDVVISVPMKSGTTWTMNIVHQLREKGDRGFEEIYDEVKWIETMRTPESTVEEMAKVIDEMPENRPRAFKTHASPPMLPFKESVKYIVVLRNPEEAVVSMKSFTQKHSPDFLTFWGMPPEAFQWPDMETYYNVIVRDGKMGVDKMLFGFAAEWWKLRNKPNVLMLHYKEMVSDHEGSIKKISDFLGYGPYTKEEWSTILEVTSFPWMKKHETRFEANNVWPIPALQKGAMMRQGSFGLARKEGLTEEMANDLAERGRKICTDLKAFDYLYNGGELPPTDE
mmetsp:Transcript_11032/g.25954  ORF Transcript_11032/g.25954 Transcript_11032/m.25954 type:complete len:314 (-) Transcript_11032:281-1222(-)